MVTLGKLRFSRVQRLKKASEYKALFEDPDLRISSRAFLLLVKKNTLQVARLGIVVGKNKAKRAVDRNFIKRQMRESFRQHQEELNGYDFVLLLRQFDVKEHRENVRTHLESLWPRLLAKVRQD